MEELVISEIFKVASFRNVIDKLFKLGHFYKDENNDVMELLVKFLVKSLFGEQVQKDIEEKIACKSECWIVFEYNEKVKDYWNIGYGNYIVKMVDDDGLEDEVKNLSTTPLNFAAFVLSNRKKTRNNFFHTIDGFYTNDVYYSDTDSLYIEFKHCDKLDNAGLFQKNLLQGKNDYRGGGILYGLFLAPIKYNDCTKTFYEKIVINWLTKGYNFQQIGMH